MAYTAQYVEGLKALFEDLGIALDTPILWCDNRAAVHLTSSPGEWRTKALVNRVLGVRSLVELKVLLVKFKATLDMQADVLTKFMGGKILSRQRDLVGCVPLDHAASAVGPGGAFAVPVCIHIGFIDFVCMPLYKVGSMISPIFGCSRFRFRIRSICND